jgi:hypothetical protein
LTALVAVSMKITALVPEAEAVLGVGARNP